LVHQPNGNKKRKKEGGVSDEKIIFEEEKTEWERSDNFEVAEAVSEKILHEENMNIMETRWRGSTCVREGMDTSDEPLQATYRNEKCGTTGDEESLSFEDIKGDDISDSVSTKQSMMSFSQYLRTFKRKSSKLAKIIYTGDSKSFEHWSEEAYGARGMEHVRWGEGCMKSSESYREREYDELIACPKHTRSEKVRDLLRADSLSGSNCSEMTEKSEKYVLENMKEMQSNTNQIH